MASILEVDLVTHVEPQRDRAKESLQAASGKNGGGVSGGYVADRALKSSAGILIRRAEIDQPALNVPNNIAASVEAGAFTHANKINVWTAATEIEVVGKCPDLDVVFGALRHQWWRRPTIAP